jgi:hypothetical protein
MSIKKISRYQEFRWYEKFPITYAFDIWIKDVSEINTIAYAGGIEFTGCSHECTQF